MKKRAVIILLICSIFVCIVLPFSSISYADPFTAGQIASTAYAMMEGWGISFAAGSASASGMNDFMTGQVQDYVNSMGGSISDVFTGQIAVDVAGKLVVGHQMYNSVVGFLDWLKDKYDLGDTSNALTDGLYDGKFLPYEETGGSSITGVGIEAKFSVNRSGSYMQGYQAVSAYNDGANVETYLLPNIPRNQGFSGVYNIVRYGDAVAITCPYYNLDTGAINGSRTISVATSVQFTNSLSWSVSEDWTMPTVLNPDKEWTGTIGGYSTPDTNLDQLLGNIDQAVADNNLVVDGDVIDVPVPPGPVPTWTPVDDVIDGINQTGEILDGIGNDIGDIAGHVDDLGDQIGDVTDALEGVQQGIQTQTGVISGAMDQAAQDVADAIGSQTGTLSGAMDQAAQDVADAIGSQTAVLDESLTATAEGIQDIADILTAPDVDTPKFDLRELFPFCIPFDIYHLLQKFEGTPAAPHIQLPIVIPSIGFSYTLDLDFSVWNPVAAAMRTAELIVYALGLAWATSKVIKW